MRRCWGSSRRMTWRLSPRSSLWPTNVPDLPRIVHGTRRHRLESPRWAAQVLLPRAVARRRRRTTAMRGCSLLLWSSRLRLGAGTSAASAHGHREATMGHALCTSTVATGPRNATRSSSSRSAWRLGMSRDHQAREARQRAARQASKDGSPPRRRPGKEKVDEGDAAAGERDLGY
jgi:hypothetical protein